jgi:2,3-bisphosphoglycerate-independent phosphoglycerate mutase
VRPPGHGESQPRLDDDRLPVVLVVLDGLGDRPVPELGGHTPSEAASTPVLDALARRGASGWHLPFGWGRAPSSELAHWAMFGFADVPFPGRAVLEGIGAGLDVERGTAMTYAALRTSRVEGEQLWVTGRAGGRDEEDAAALLAGLGPVLERYAAQLRPLGSRGEALLAFPGHACGDVSDSDPFFEDFHPWLRVLPIVPAGATGDTPAGATGGPPVRAMRGAPAGAMRGAPAGAMRGAPAGAPLAAVLNDALLDARAHLLASPVNAARLARGLPALDLLTTKWSGARTGIPSFVEQTGVAGAAVTSTRLYRGLAGILGMSQRHLPPVADVSADLAARLVIAAELVEEGARFVHVHTKATDEAGHTKLPHAKRDVLEAADAGLAGLEALAERAIVAVTGDHATPSTHGVLHTGDPTPLVVAGPGVRPDGVTEFGEAPARAGWYGCVRAAELLPLLFGHANRPAFLGHRATARPTLALPDAPEPMPLRPVHR